MTTQPIFKLKADGSGYDIQPAGVLILLAGEVFEHPEFHTNGRIQCHIESFLSAARDGGYTQSDILMTLLARGEFSHRVTAMAVQACEAAGNEAMCRIFDAMRGKK